MSRTIKRVINSGAIDAGHAIQITVEFVDGSEETMRCETHNAPNLVQALIQASSAAEKLRRIAPAQSIEVEAPFHATSARVGMARDAQGAIRIGVKFATTAAVPVMVSMTPNLAQETIDKIEAQIDRLGKLSPDRRSN